MSTEIMTTQPTEWELLRAQATTYVRSGFLPRAINTPEKALTIMMAGRELGIGPMQALRHLSVVDGKPVIASELIAGMVFRRHPKAVLRVQSTTNTECVVLAGRPGDTPTEFRWTIQDAANAGLAGKDNWKKYPRAMLQRRCIAEAARSVFPDATMGAYDPDELGIPSDESGVIVVEHVTPSPETAMLVDDYAGCRDNASFRELETKRRAVWNLASSEEKLALKAASIAAQDRILITMTVPVSVDEDAERAAIQEEG